MKSSSQNNGNVTRERLIEAAGEVFGEKGLHGATIRDITQRAGANIASVNYHFRDKFELYLTVVRHIQDSLDAAVNQPLTAETAEGRLRQWLAAMLMAFHNASRPNWHGQMVVRELFDPTPALVAGQSEIQKHFGPLAQIVREIRPDLSEEQVMLATCGMVAQVLFHNHHEHLARHMFPAVPAPSLDKLINHVTEFSLGALRGLPPAGVTAARPRFNEPSENAATHSKRVKRHRSASTRT